MADSVKNDDSSQAANQSDNENHSHSRQPLPSIHPDDARDKVFTAIMKALLKVGNKPSSPRELSNVITKYKYATLGGATPFATVSSRISQHFKRAAEHNPPRAPLLAKHVDQRHARKINYSLITDTIESGASNVSDSTATMRSSKSKKDSEKPDHYLRSSTRRAESSDSSSPLSSEEDEGKASPETVHHTRSMDKRKRSTTTTTTSAAIKLSPTLADKSAVRAQRPRRKTNSQYARRTESGHESNHEADDEHHQESDNEIAQHPSKRSRMNSSTSSSIVTPSSNGISHSNSSSLPPSSAPANHVAEEAAMPSITAYDEGADSESEFSDYHEEMLKGDEVMDDAPASNTSDEKKSSTRRPYVKSSIVSAAPAITSRADQPSSTTPSSAAAPNPSHISPRLMGKKTTSGLLGDQDLWLPYSFDQDFDNVFLSDNSCVAHHVPLNIATPESISVSELDNYFTNTSNGSRKPNRRSNNCNGDFKGSPLLQKVLLSKQSQSDENGTRPQAEVDAENARQDTAEPMILDEEPSSPVLETPDDSSVGSSDDDGYHSARRIQPYHIVEKVFGPLRVFELDSPGDIPNTKVMRFIGATDGSNNNIARRTRNAETKSQKNSQHHYLDEGYVNATQLRKAAQPVLGKGSFDANAESERSNVVVSITNGPMECRGAWQVFGVPLNRARELVEEYEIESSLGLMKLLSDEPISQEAKTRGQEQDGDKLVTSSPSATVSTPPSPRSLECSSQQQTSPLAVHSAVTTAESSEELSSEHVSESDDDDSFVKFEDTESKAAASPDSVSAPNIAPNVTSSVASSVPPSTGPTTPMITSTSSLISAMTTSPATAAAVAAASSNVNSTLLSAVEILKTLNISNLNLQTLHQIAAAIPNLAHLAPTLKSVSSNPPSSSSPGKASATPPVLDIKAALSHFSTLEALLKKEPSKQPSTTTSESTPSSPSKPSSDASGSPDQPVIISTTVPTTPHMYITIVDNVAVYVTVLSEANGVEGEHLLMRRVDNGYINGTTLLKAGGIETEQERSIVLSLEVGRVRIPNKASRLHGTWIPLRRAQALAATCSLQHKLGPFLNDTVDSYFPNPLPISLPVSKKSAEGRLTAVTLTSLRSSNGSSKNGFLSHHQQVVSGPTSPNNNSNGNAQLQQLLLSHPNKSLKIGDHSLKAPMLGSFDDEHEKSHKKKKREISVVSSSQERGIASPNASVLSPVTIKSGPTSPSPPLHNLPTPDNDVVSPSSFVDVVNEEVISDDDDDDDTDTDTDVEEVREKMKKMRAAAIDAMENGSSVDLDEIISRARSPLAYHSTQPTSSSTRRPLRSSTSKRHRDERSIGQDDDDDDEDDEDDDHIPPPPINRPRRTHSNIYHAPNRIQTYGRRRPTGGKWAGGGGGKLAPSMVKKSASWNGSLSKSSHIVVPTRRTAAAKSSSETRSSNRSIAANTETTSTTKLTLIVASPLSEKSTTTAVVDEDEDEEIDIGGSDRDDDLR